MPGTDVCGELQARHVAIMFNVHPTATSRGHVVSVHMQTMTARENDIGFEKADGKTIVKPIHDGCFSGHSLHKAKQKHTTITLAADAIDRTQNQKHSTTAVASLGHPVACMKCSHAAFATGPSVKKLQLVNNVSASLVSNASDSVKPN